MQAPSRKYDIYFNFQFVTEYSRRNVRQPHAAPSNVTLFIEMKPLSSNGLLLEFTSSACVLSTVLLYCLANNSNIPVIG